MKKKTNDIEIESKIIASSEILISKHIHVIFIYLYGTYDKNAKYM